MLSLRLPKMSLHGRGSGMSHEGSAAWLKTYVRESFVCPFVIGTRSFHVDEGCISCGICGKSCPVGNIRLVDGHPVWGSSAFIVWLVCIFAPRKVIQYGKATQKKGKIPVGRLSLPLHHSHINQQNNIHYQCVDNGRYCNNVNC